jgi:integrase/recombinase XerD
MKKLIVKNSTYQKLEKDFTKFLQSSGYSKSSQTYLPLHVREFLHWQEQRNKELEDWESIDFIGFLDYVKERKNERKSGGLSAAHINKIIQALQLLQQYLNNIEQLNFYVKLNQEATLTTPPEIFSRAEMAILYEACENKLIGLRMRAILALCYGCGLRKGEAVALNTDDVWWERSVVQVRKSKTGRSRLVPMARGVQDDLKCYLDFARPKLEGQGIQAAFLLSFKGERLKPGTIYDAFRKHLKLAGMRLCGLHVLRHSIASHLSESGMSSEQIARFLGHRTLDSTQIYVQINPTNYEHK